MDRNLTGRIILHKPDKWYLGHAFGTTINLPITILDQDGLGSFEVHGVARTFFKKRYPKACARRAIQCKGSKRVIRETLQLKLDVSEWNDGKHTLIFELEDLEGEIIKRKLVVVSDQSGPDIQFVSPKNLTVLTQNAKITFTVKDFSPLREVRLTDNGELLKTWAGNSVLFLRQTPNTTPTYVYPLDYSAQSPGLHRFIVTAEDKKGNKSSQELLIRVNSRGVGALCTKTGRCKRGLVCLRRKFESLARCRKPCRYSRECPKYHRCTRYEQQKLCFPVMRRFQSKAFGICNKTFPCSESLLCARIGKEKIPRCYPRCGAGYPTCPKKLACRDFGNQKLCAKPLPKRFQGLAEGKLCNAKLYCKKGLTCARLSGQPARCMRQCKRGADCKPGDQCLYNAKTKLGLCYTPRDEVKASQFQSCGAKVTCEAGLLCMGIEGGGKRCQKTCKKPGTDCDGGTICAPLGTLNICTKACNPNTANPCPKGMQCRFVPDLKTKITYVCL